MGKPQVDYSPQLQQLMQRKDIPSYRALGERAGISQWTINLLRQGQVARLRVEALMKLSQTLATPLPDLIALFTGTSQTQPERASAPRTSETQALRQEYDRLRQQLADQEAEIRKRVQGDAIATLESWLLQWPTAVYAVQNNPDLPASRLLPLTKPLNALLESWNILPIGTVGESEPFDPTIHQPLKGNPCIGEWVRIRNLGYRQGERILYRAKVSPNANP
jgi:DNA-binding Xre family transcriptional regulator/molecular chaperone GrpE (heat shock protein)